MLTRNQVQNAVSHSTNVPQAMGKLGIKEKSGDTFFWLIDRYNIDITHFRRDRTMYNNHYPFA